MNLKEYRDWAATKWNGKGINSELPSPVVEQLLNATVGVAGEVGELTDIVKKLAFHGHEYTDGVDFAIRKELGDILYYWVTLCRLFGVDPDQVLALNVRKLNARYPEGFNEKDSENRAQDDL